MTAGSAPLPLLLERDRELQWFEQRLAALRRDDTDAATCVLIHGEAGAGKTALMQAVRSAAGNDVLWLRGACEPLLAAGALMPLVDLLDELPRSLAQAVRSGRATLEVLAGMLALLRDRARPAVLVIDDVQWADGATLDLARYLGRRIAATRALLVLCWRDTTLAADHPLRLLLGGLPPRHTQRFALEPLSPRAVADLAQRAGRSAKGLHAATRGNPFFVTEWLAGDGLRLPAAVRDAVLARLAPLSDAARDIVELVSAAPAGLEPDVIDSIIEDSSAALGEAIAAGLLQREGTVLRFRHELARQSVQSACEAAAWLHCTARCSTRSACVARRPRDSSIMRIMAGCPRRWFGSRRSLRTRPHGLARRARQRRTWRSRFRTRQRSTIRAAPSCTWRVRALACRSTASGRRWRRAVPRSRSIAA